MPSTPGATATSGDRLMIDPSLLFHRASFAAVRETVEESREPLWVADPIVSAVVEPTGVNRGRPFHFVAPQVAADLGEVAQLLQHPNVKRYLGHTVPNTGVEYEDFLRLVRDEFVASVLWAEWAFLLSESWIAARVKRTFTTFQRVGASALEVSAETFDRVTRRTLKTTVPKPLTPGQRFRAAAKWIAAGGAPLAPLLGPVGVALGVGAGIFLVVDP